MTTTEKSPVIPPADNEVPSESSSFTLASTVPSFTQPVILAEFEPAIPPNAWAEALPFSASMFPLFTQFTIPAKSSAFSSLSLSTADTADEKSPVIPPR